MAICRQQRAVLILTKGNLTKNLLVAAVVVVVVVVEPVAKPVAFEICISVPVIKQMTNS